MAKNKSPKRNSSKDSDSNDDDPRHKSPEYKPFFVWFVVVTSALGQFLQGYGMAVLNPLFKYFAEVLYKWNDEDVAFYQGLANSTLALGAGAGAFFGSLLCRKIGLKFSMIGSDVFGFLGVGLTLVKVYPAFLVGRSLIGIAIGINSTVLPEFIGEFSPTVVRSRTGVFVQVMSVSAAIVALSLGFGLPSDDDTESNWWRVMLVVPIITVVLRTFILLVFLRIDTPKFLAKEHKDDKLNNVLKRVYKEGEVDKAKEAINEEIEDEASNGDVKFREVFQKRWRKQLFIACFISLMRQMSGVGGITFYSNLIFETTTGSRTALLFTVITRVVQLIATCATELVVKKFGRRPIILVGCVLICLCHVAIFFCGFFDQQILMQIPVYLFFICFGLTHGAVIRVYIVDILPVSGVGIAMLVTWLSTLMVAQLFPLLFKQIEHYTFLIFAAFMAFSFFVCWKYVKETKGTSFQDIQKLFQSSISEKDFENSQELLSYKLQKDARKTTDVTIMEHRKSVHLNYD